MAICHRDTSFKRCSSKPLYVANEFSINLSAHETGFCRESASDCEYALLLGFGDFF